MNEYLLWFIYSALGILGSCGHYLKKQYVDHTINLSLHDYIINNFPATVYTLIAIAFSEAGLSELNTGDYISIQNILGAITMGYTFDSGLNKTE